MSEDPIQDFVVATASAIIATHAKDAFYIMLGIWYSAFGHSWDLETDKIQVEHLKNLGEFRNELVQEINTIAPENIQPPKTSIAGPALEASKYYMDEDEIRQMFARLIATSMDKTRSHQAHHAYVEIIKMLSPLDAKNLYYLNTLEDETICNRIIKIGNTGTHHLINSNVWLGNPENPSQELQQISIENLARLGLVSITYESFLSDDGKYQHHKKHRDYLKLEKEVATMVEQARIDLDKLNQFDRPITDAFGNLLDDNQRQELITKRELQASWQAKLQNGMITMTAFGSNLCKVCLPVV